MSDSERLFKFYNLSGKPFTKALLLRGSNIRDKADQELKKIEDPFLKIIKDSLYQPTLQEKTLHEFAANCTHTIVFDITEKAAKNIDLVTPFLPSKSVPKYASTVVAYSLFILTGLYLQLKKDHVELGYEILVGDTACSLFKLHNDEERAKNAMAGIEAFKAFTKSDDDNYKKWHDDLMILINMYIFQWTKEDLEIKNYDFIPQFGS